MPFSWTEAKEKLLLHLWNDKGWSAREIAEKLGTTRNSVIGKAHRIGAKRRADPIINRKTPRVKLEPVEFVPYEPIDATRCMWPMKGGYFCGCKTLPRRPYCPSHTKAATLDVLLIKRGKNAANRAMGKRN